MVVTKISKTKCRKHDCDTYDIRKKIRWHKIYVYQIKPNVSTNIYKKDWRQTKSE